MKPPVITLAEVLNEIQTIQCRDDSGATVDELAQATEHSKEWVLRRLRVAMREHKIAVGRKRITDLSGRIQRVPCYRVK
jgi:hypothetical protein